MTGQCFLAAWNTFATPGHGMTHEDEHREGVNARESKGRSFIKTIVEIATSC